MQNIRERIRKKGHRMFPCGGFLFAGKRSFGAKKELDNYYTKNGKHSRIVLWKLTNTGEKFEFIRNLLQFKVDNGCVIDYSMNIP